MGKWVWIVLLAAVPASVCAEGLEGLLREVSRAIVEEFENPSEADRGQGQLGSQMLQAEHSPSKDDYERTTVTWLDCRRMLGWQPTVRAQQECSKKHLTNCSNWLETLPVNADGEEKFRKFFRYGSGGKCEVAQIADDRDQYGAQIKAKEFQFEQHRKNMQHADCLSRLEEIPIAEGSSKLISNLDCPYETAGFEEYRKKRESKLTQIAPLEAAARSKQYAGLIHKHSQAVRIPANILTSTIAVQWGGSIGLRLIEFIDLAQANPRSKAVYEMDGKNLIMRQRIADPMTRKSVEVVYAFVPAEGNEVILSRMVVGGKEVPMKDIPQVFSQIAVAMKNG